MSTTIDSRVVEMRFDNRQFESNVQTSLSTLDKLKNSLNMDGATKSFEQIDNAAKKIDMSGLGSAIETVKTRFSALEVMAVTALANITNSVINTGKQMLSSLTIAPISQGFSEYELKMNSIQTIMMSTGASLEEVNGYLNELNTYADKTIYSFADMTANIGKFTNAGVKLEDAVMAIQGVSNVAAVSGANSAEASRAMYNFSQALSSGFVKLIDWKSIENANMATVEFKNQLLESAVACGTLEKTADGMYRVLSTNAKGDTMDYLIDATHNFNDSLSYQWMTTDALVHTLRDYADETTEIGKKSFSAAQDIKTFTQLMDTLKEAVGSGWARTWEILFGEFDEAKKLWTDLGKVVSGFIESQSNARNDLLQGWKDLGGRTEIIDTVKNVFAGLKSVIIPITEAFREIFPPMTVEQLHNITAGLLKFTENLKLSDTASANLKSTFKGLFAVVDIIGNAFMAVVKAISPLLGGVNDLGGGLLSITGSFGEWLIKLNETIETTDIFNKVLGGIMNFIKVTATAIKNFITTVAQNFKIPGFELFHNLLERVQARMSQVGEAAGGMKSAVVVAFELMSEALANCQFVQILQTIWNVVKTIASGLVKALGSISGAITSSLGEANFSGIIDLLNGISFGAIAIGITKFVSGFRKAIDEIGSIKESFIGILDSVRGCFEAYQTQLKAGTLLKIASAIAILAASLIALSLIDSEKLNSALGGITVLFADLMVSMAVFNKISGKTSGVTKSVTAMLGIATSVIILAIALKNIGDLNTKQLTTGLVGVVVLIATMVAAAKVMGSGTKTIIKGATQMVIFAAAIKVLASVCEDLSKLSWMELAKGLVGVGVLLAEVSLFMNTAKFSGKSITTATGIVILSAAMKILASACKDFGSMKWGEIAKGLAAIGALLAEIALFTNLTGNAKHVMSTGVALIAISASMKIFASAVQDFSSLSWEEIAKGLVAMAGALTSVTLAVNFMPKNMVGIGIGLITVSAALVIMANALNKMSSMTWEEIAKGLVTLGGAMVILAVGLNAMTGTFAGSAAMLVAASALLVLTPVLSILGAMSWESIAKGLVSLAGSFAVIGVAGLVLAPLVPTILGLSGAFALIGVSVLGIGTGLALAGAGLSALAIGVTALAAAGTAGATAIVASLTVIVTGIAELIPAIVTKIGEAIVAFCKVIADSASAIGEAVKSVVLMLVDVFVECVPAIADGVLKLVAGVLESLVEYTPSIVDSIFKFLIGVLEGVARNLPGLIQAAIDVFMSFFSGLIDALKGIDTSTLIEGIVGIGLLSALMLALSAVASLVPGAMVGVIGMGAVIAELALVLAAIGALAQIPGLNWLINEGGSLLQSIGAAIGGFIGGIVGGFMSGVSSQFPQIATDLSGFMTNIQPFLEGAASINPSMMDGIKALAETILVLTAANILEGLTSWLTGGSSLTGFAEELVPFGKAMKQFSKEIAGIDGEVVANAATAGKTLAEMAATLPNSGGVVGWFTGENDMNAFGEQLIPFGKAMKSFADEVAGLDAAVVTEAATAGKALAEMATTVPNSGGVVGFFAGENDMSAFGEQLVPFGKAMKEYADAVSGLKSDVIQNSVTAGQALIELANTVPNTGGVIGWFTGNNDLSTFGDQLVPFGSAMKEYSLSVDGIDADIITNSANAAKALAELSDSLPNTGGLVSWFTGDNDIGSFGKQLATFGDAFSQYYDSIKGINVSKLSGVVKEFNTLVDLAISVKDIDTSGLSRFAKNLKKLADSGIDEFIGSFDNSDERVTTAAKKMITTFIDSANSKKEDLMGAFVSLINSAVTTISCQYVQFTTAGNNTISNFISGVKANDNYVRTSFSTFVSNCLTTISNKYYDFINAGNVVITKFIDGVKAKNQIAKTSFSSIVSGCITSVRNKYTDFYNAGTYLVQGFANGISDYTWYATSKATTMAKSTADAMEKELSINSPSKVSYRIAGFFGQGFINNLVNYTDKAYDAGESIAASAKDGLHNAVSKISDYIESGIDSQPTIRPILDLSQVKEGAGRLSALLSRNQAMSIGSVMNRETTGNIQNGNNTPSTGNSYNFVQNNYSPKALSRIDIYRQTKNQFSAMKGLVET